MNFKEFKKKQNGVADKIKTLNSRPDYSDSRKYSPKKDSSGESTAILRFLPQKDPELSPIVKFYTHGFNEKGQWFIEDCPSTIGKDCPVCAYARSVYDEKVASTQVYYRKARYAANVLIVKDELQPELEGKVMIFEFGNKIFKKISNAIYDEDEAIEVFDFDGGHDFKIKITQVSGWNNYDESKFLLKPTAVADGDDEAQEEIFNSLFDLETEYKAESKFKSAEEIGARFDRVMGTSASTSNSSGNNIQEDMKKPATKKPVPTEPDLEEDDDDVDLEDLDLDDIDI